MEFPQNEETNENQDLRIRILRSFMDIKIADILFSQDEITGYEVVLVLHQEYGKLYSPGTIYPILKKMEKKHLITRRAVGHRTPYALTPKGGRWFDEISKEFPEILQALRITKGLRKYDSHKISTFEPIEPDE